MLPGVRLSHTAPTTTSPDESTFPSRCAVESQPSITTTMALWICFLPTAPSLPELVKTTPEFYNCLLRNRGDGTFEDVTARAGLTGSGLGFSFGVAVADYDNDGFDDIFICNAGANTLYHNNGNGTFTDVSAASGLTRKGENVLSVGAAWFDYNNDGLLDLIVTNYTAWTPQADKTCRMDANARRILQPHGLQERCFQSLSQPG